MLTKEAYLQLRERIETKYNEDMAALDKVWALASIEPAPDSPVRIANIPQREIPEDKTDAPIARGRRGSLKGLTIDQIKERRREYARRWYQTNGAKKKVR